MTLRIGCLVMPWISRYRACAAEGLEWESTTTTPSLVRITAALEFTLYRGAAMAAYTPSATCLSSKRSLSAVLASAANTQQGSRCSNVWMAAAATPTRVKNCRRVQCVLMRYPLSCQSPVYASPLCMPQTSDLTGQGHASLHSAEHSRVSSKMQGWLVERCEPRETSSVRNPRCLRR